MCEHGCSLGEDWRHHFSASEHQNPPEDDPPTGFCLGGATFRPMNRVQEQKYLAQANPAHRRIPMQLQVRTGREVTRPPTEVAYCFFSCLASRWCLSRQFTCSASTNQPRATSSNASLILGLLLGPPTSGLRFRNDDSIRHVSTSDRQAGTRSVLIHYG